MPLVITIERLPWSNFGIFVVSLHPNFDKF